jgi:methyl-accepting chemotaxis protein
MTLFDNLPLARKLMLLTAGALVVWGMVLAGFALTVRQQMIAARLEQLRDIVDTALGLAGELDAQVKAGQLSRDAAQAEFMRDAAAMTYDKGHGHMLAMTMDGVMIAAADKGLIGRNQIDVATNGTPVARLLRDGVRQDGETVLRYADNRPGGTVPLPTIVYAAGFPAWNILIGSGASLDDIDAAFAALAMRLAAVVLTIAAVFVGSGWLASRRISAPLNRLEARMGGLAAGELEAAVPDAGRKDEIGNMARAVRVFRENAVRVRELEQQQAAVEAAAEARRRAAIADLMHEFEARVGGVAGHLATTATVIRDGARTLTDAAAETTRESAEVAATGQTASGDVQAVVGAADELSGSITQISHRVGESAEIAQRAVAETSRAGGSVRQLSESALRIGEIVSLINGIATQTNLLALNATIEAARAGEAGKGFAVVASEVKAFANQTARATGDIREQIEGMQTATGETVAAVANISGTIGQLSEIAAGIAASVQQQGAATHEIARSMQRVAVGTQKISASIGHVSAMAGRTGGEASRLLSAADTLGEQADDLRVRVNGLLAAMQAA